MRRFLLAFLMLAGPARAGVVDAPAPSPDPATNRINLQAAIDRAGADGVGLVRLPAGTWTLDRTLFLDRSANSFASVSLRGEGPGLTVLKSATGRAADLVSVGLDRKPRYPGGPVGGAALTPDHFLSTAGLLDPTAAGHWAYRTGGDTHFVQMGGPFDQGPGDWYGRTRQLTLDAAVWYPDARSLDAALFGLRDGFEARPFSLIGANMGGTATYYVTLTTQGPDYPSDPESATTRRFYLWPNAAAPLAPGLARVTLQFDLDAASPIAAWYQGRPLTVEQRGGPPWAKGESFYPNQHAPFTVGTSHASASGLIEYQGSIRDFAVCGLKITAAALYDPARADQARADGKPLTDSLRYFTPEAQHVALLPLDEPPSLVCADRSLATVGKWKGTTPGRSSGYVLDNKGHASTFSGIAGVTIERMTLQCDDTWSGRAVTLGLANDFRVRDCHLMGGSHGLGAISLDAEYPLTLADVKLQGRDAPLFVYLTSSATAERIWLDGTPYRAAVRVVAGDLSVTRLHTPHWGTPEYGFCVRRGSIRIKGCDLDNETAGLGSTVADIYVTPFVTQQPLSAVVDIDQFDGVFSGPKSSKILLGGPAKSDPKRTQVGTCLVRVRGLAVHPAVSCRSVVRVLPTAEGLWSDGGIELGTFGAVPFTAYEGPALNPPRPVDTNPVAVPAG